MLFLLGTLLSLFSANVMAQNIHYFGSIKAGQTNIDSNDISFDEIKNKTTVTPLTTAGFSFDANLDDRFQALAQFIYINNSYIGVDLLQLRYHISPSLVLRVGRQRLPFNLHSENIQVQALLPWMSAPREVYGRAPIYSFTGLSVEQALGDNFGLHLYSGDTKDNFENGDVEYKTSTSNLIGARLNFKHNHFNGFVNLYRGEGDLQVKTDIDATQFGNPVPGTTVGLSEDYKLEAINGFTTGLQYRHKDYFVMSEYNLLSTKNPVIERTEAAYVTVGKEFIEKWITVFTFSTDLDVASALSPSKTTTYAFNLNYRLDYNNMLKAGIEHVNFKERTVSNGFGGLPYNGSVFTNGSLNENFEVVSLMWAFVY